MQRRRSLRVFFQHLASRQKRTCLFSTAMTAAGLDLPAERMVLRLSGSLPGSATAAHMSKIWTASTSSSPYTWSKKIGNKPRRNLAHGEAFGGDLSLLSAAGWTHPTLSSQAMQPPFFLGSLRQWWANDAHQQWAWEWDFYLEV